jgi:hypothetical protein
LVEFSFDKIPQNAIDELIDMVGSAEERSKIALIDLLRILFQYEGSAAHILYKHWETFDISIFQYLLCVDIKDASNKVLHNYHLVCLKMLGNIYQTTTGLEFIMDDTASQQLLDFCNYSLTSSNPKSVFTAAVIVFNHVLTFKRDLSPLLPQFINLIQSSIEILATAKTEKGLNDNDAISAMLLAEIRILYKNDAALSKVQADFKDKFVSVHR